MTKIVSPPWTIRVWRQEPLDYQQSVRNVDLRERAMNACVEVGGDAFFIAMEIMGLDRVNAVEVLDADGNGEVLYKDWP